MNKNYKNIISTAMSHEVATEMYSSKSRDKFPGRFLQFFSGRMNPNSFQDNALVSEVDTHDFMDWNSLERNKAIRILARDITLLDRIDINIYDFSIIEFYPLFLRYPDLIFDLSVDLTNLKTSEAILLLECNQDLVDHIDIFDYNFNKRDMIQIIKKFKTSEKIMNKLNLSSLDHYSIRRLLCETGDSYIDNIDKGKLKATDWLEILEYQPELLNYCDLKIFELNDCYILTKLVILFPELEYMIYNNINKISGLGWENLLKGDVEKYQDLCKWEKLSESNWNNIIRIHPEFKSLKQKYFLF